MLDAQQVTENLDQYAASLKLAILIRKTEEKLLSLFSEGRLNGTVHTCIGQEFIAVAAEQAIKKGDSVFSNHRGHGHFLAVTGDVSGLFAEIMGKSTGVSGGRGGSQHMFASGFHSTGVQGGLVPISAGAALSEKMTSSNNIAIVFIGDGTLGQGVLYETLNVASVWQIPLMVVVENNHVAQTTLQKEFLGGTIEGRAKAFNIEYRKSNTWQWKELIKDFKSAADFTRTKSKACILEIETYRLAPHSKGDDTRDSHEIDQANKKDPLNQILEDPSEEIQKMISEIDNVIEKAVGEADESGISEIQNPSHIFINDVNLKKVFYKSDRIVALINQSFHENFSKNSDLIILGEDIKSPYGGAFKVTKDLSARFPNQVINTPISESALVGLGTGLALGGKLPIVEIMFGDFLTLCFDQLFNHCSKLKFMSNDKLKVPLIIRTPMGGKRGYGPTHSQSLERHFLGIYSLDILALNSRVSPYQVYNTLFQAINKPTLVLENKILYTKFLNTKGIDGFEVKISDEQYPTVCILPIGKKAHVTIFCYGEMLTDVEQAVEVLFDEHDIICEVICPTQIQPLNIQPTLNSVNQTGCLITVEEGGCIAGLSSELISCLIEKGAELKTAKRLSCNSLIPSSLEMEKQVIPDKDSIISAVVEVVHHG